MNITRFTIVVDNCDKGCEELTHSLLKHKDGESDLSEHLKVVKGYYPKEYCIQVDTPERVQEVMDIIEHAHSIGEDI
jgi:hypothetical protein